MPRALALLSLFLVPALLAAQASPGSGAVPPVLRDWQPWVLKDLEYRACPFFANRPPAAADDFICAWPGRLVLAATGAGAAFSIAWRVEAPSFVPLPGDGEHWPQQVEVNGARAPVLAHGGRPALWLAPGKYTLAGRIPWRERPQAIAVPGSIGLLALSVDGKPVAPIERNGSQVTLGRAAAQAVEADSLDVRVYRRLVDEVPARLDTRIVLAVSGQAREASIGPLLPPGFEPLALTGAWPARLDADGRLRVQVQPGSQTIVVDARAIAPLQAVTARLPAASWPKQEIWSYQAAPQLRVTVADGGISVDPRQAEVPGDWQALPAFALGDGAVLKIEQRSRGLAADADNRLTLRREAWLDFDGGGWYARDQVSGSMANGWRFDVAAPFTLEQASAGNLDPGRGGQPLLVTRGATAGLTGVEWRTPRVALAAGLRIGGAATLPVAGWQRTFDGVSATLHFPFGYKLLAAFGADNAGGSWAAAWTLLDVFVCAIAVLLAWRLLGLAGAAATLAYLLLAYQENGAPFWSLVALLGLSLVARALPGGALARGVAWLRRLALLAFVLLALPFAAQQVRDALYPQLESGAAGTAWVPQAMLAGKDLALGGAPAELSVDEARIAAPPPMQQGKVAMEMAAPASPPMAMPASNAAARMEAKSRLRDVRANQAALGRYADSTVVQTGAGAPDWQLGSTAWLAWSGPVLATQTVRLLVAPPWLVRALRVVLALLLAWLGWRLVRGPAAPPSVGGSLRPGAALLLVALAGVADVHAQALPSPELLQQLRERLTEAPPCAPQCAAFAQAQVSASADAVDVALEAHAAARAAVPLPNDPAAALNGVRVDGTLRDDVVRDDAGVLWIAVERGVHRIELAFAASGDKVALAFPLRPARVQVEANGWTASGLADDRLLTETLTLARVRNDAAATLHAGAQQFAPFVRVVRNLSLGLEWTAATEVERLAPRHGGFAIDLPLLPGEHVATGGIKVRDGKVQVALGETDAGAGWRSTLDRADTLSLTAPALQDHAEVWTVLVGPAWHLEFSGVPQTAGAGAADDFHRFEFHPLPGETLTLRLTRPAPAQGAARAIDAVALHTDVGTRAATHTLDFTLRASQGGEHAIALPRSAEVLAVARDGATLNLRPLDGRLSLPVVPGTQRFHVQWRSGDAVAWRVRTPDVTLGLPAANIALSLQLPGDRWLLATSGPPVGPAVLYWGELVVTIAVAWALARTRRTRLRFRHWLLLGLGFSTFSWFALLVVVAWLFAFDWRSRAAMPGARWRFNLVQAALVALTVVAVLCLAPAIPQGLLGQPDMHVAGNGSSAYTLRWFADRSADVLPGASAFSVPLWAYKVLMLAWALWLANALIGWLRTAFAAWSRDGYWRPKSFAAAPAAVPPDAGPAS